MSELVFSGNIVGADASVDSGILGGSGIQNIWDQRNEDKQRIDSINVDNLYINVREIRFIKLGKKIGNEQNGKKGFVRPFLVMKRVGNQLRGIPLTTGGKSDSLFYYSLDHTSFYDIHHQQKQSKACLGHAKTVDKKRFVEKIGLIDEETYHLIQKNLQQLYL